MKQLLIALLFFPFIAFSQQVEEVIIGGFTFNLAKESSEDFLLDTLKKPIIPFSSQIVLSRNGKKLLTHTLSEYSVDCNSISLELGYYEIQDSSIFFYSYWAWDGICNGCPQGIMRQIYTVNNKGKLKPELSEIFMDYRHHEFSQMSGAEKKAHIKEIEKRYNATFMGGRNAAYLELDITRQLKDKITAIKILWAKLAKMKLEEESTNIRLQ